MQQPVQLEMYYSMTCPNCKILDRMLNDVLPGYGDKIKLKKILISSPSGYIKSLKLGIHSVPTLVLDGKIIFRQVPEKSALIQKLNQTLQN